MKQLTVLLIACTISFASKAQTKIDVTDAAKHMNETVTICTKVYGVKALDKVTLINLGAKYPESPLTIAIAAADREAFNDLASLNGKDICVTGKIIDYKGKTEIIITKKEEITVEEKQEKQ